MGVQTLSRNENLHLSILYPIVFIRVDGSNGGGGILIYLGKGGTFVLTNYFVIEEAISIEKEWNSLLEKNVKKEIRKTINIEYFSYKHGSHCIGKIGFEGDIIIHSQRDDLALIKVRTDDSSLLTANLFKGKSESIKVFEDIHVCQVEASHPPIPLTRQLISVSDEVEGQRFLVADSSMPALGGGVFLGKGNYPLIGLPSKVSSKGNIIDKLMYIIPIDRVYEWLEKEHYDFIFNSKVSPGECEKKRKDKLAAIKDKE